MSKIKVAELFYSLQGEGRYMGVPSVFLRTFGCNFTCSGFGMPRGEKSEEHLKIDPSKYSKYEDLPLVSTGCDSYASWDVRFKHLSPVLTTDEIVKRIVSILPHREWRNEHLVITGGEPLLSWQRSYPALLDHPDMGGLQEITFETNGTKSLTPEFKAYLAEWKQRQPGREITFSVSAKLPVSGEDWDEAIKPNVVVEYQEVGYVYLKFVISRKQDLYDVERATYLYHTAGLRGPVYLMPVGGVESVYNLNNKAVADMALVEGYRYSDRLQVVLFKNAWGT